MSISIADFANTKARPWRAFTRLLTLALALVFLFAPVDFADAKKKKYRKYGKKHYKANHRVHRKIRRKKRYRTHRKSRRKARRAHRKMSRPNPKMVQAAKSLNIGPRYFKELQKFYATRNYKPVWTSASGLNKSGELLNERLKLAHQDGLDQSDFVLPGDKTSKSVFLDDLKISFAVIRYAEQVQAGRVSPGKIVSQFDLKPQRPNLSALLKQVSKSKNPVSILDELPPPHHQYALLKSRLAQIRSRANLINPAFAAVDAPLRLALEHATNSKQNQIIANMERWRWIPRQLGEKHVWVNLPTYKLNIKEGSQTTFTTKGIVGRKEKPTPLITSKIKNIIVNPFWHIPASVVASDILPKLQANDTSYLKEQSIKVMRRGGRILDPEKIDWTKIVNPRTYRFRQSPGEKNALGQLKVLFPNSHSIYLHDTDKPELFKSDDRAYSHGCIRLANPIGFADAIASYDNHLKSQMPGTLIGPRERWLKYKANLPVHLVYFTAEIDSSGQLKTYPDIYGYDKKMSLLFNAQKPSS